MSAHRSITIFLPSQGSQSTSQMVLKWRPKPPSFFFHCEHRDVLIIQQEVLKWLERWKCLLCAYALLFQLDSTSSTSACNYRKLFPGRLPWAIHWQLHRQIRVQKQWFENPMDDATQVCVWRATQQLQSSTQYTVNSYKVLLVSNAHLLVQPGDRYGMQSKVFIHQEILQKVQEENISTQCISQHLTGMLCVLWDLPEKQAQLGSGKTNVHWPESCRRPVKYP